MSSLFFSPLEYWQQLISAIRNNCEEDVKLLLHLCDPSLKNNQALYIAVHLGNPHIVQILLPHSIDPDWGNLLFDACAENHCDVVEILLQYAPHKHENLQSALCVSIHHRSVHCVEKLAPYVSENTTGWGLIWAGDTLEPSHRIFSILFENIECLPLSSMDWSGQPFSLQRQAHIKQCVEDAYAIFVKHRLLSHMTLASLERIKRI